MRHVSRKRLAFVAVLSLTSAVLATTGGLCALQAGCANRPSYNACLNCVSSAGCGSAGDQACWNWFRRFRDPSSPQVPVPTI